MQINASVKTTNYKLRHWRSMLALYDLCKTDPESDPENKLEG